MPCQRPLPGRRRDSVPATPEETYQFLRHLTSPIVAVTAAHGGRVNGQIANSAGRASIVPGLARVLVSLSKEHLTHDMVLASGAFCLHLLRTSQMDLVHRLGFASGRSVPKLSDGEWTPGPSRSPVLRDCYAYLDCRLYRTLDLGPGTLVIGRVLEAGAGAGEGDVLTSPYWRANMPEAWRPDYERDLREAQAFARRYLEAHPEAAGE